MPQYIAIDLKSFYASVECVERGLDPLTTNLVVADESRTEKTICLAVSPSLKKYGIPGRARLFEVVQKVKQVNRSRKTGEPELSYIAAPPFWQPQHIPQLGTQSYCFCKCFFDYCGAKNTFPNLFTCASASSSLFSSRGVYCAHPPAAPRRDGWRRSEYAAPASQHSFLP